MRVCEVWFCGGSSAQIEMVTPAEQDRRASVLRYITAFLLSIKRPIVDDDEQVGDIHDSIAIKISWRFAQTPFIDHNHQIVDIGAAVVVDVADWRVHWLKNKCDRVELEQAIARNLVSVVDSDWPFQQNFRIHWQKFSQGHHCPVMPNEWHGRLRTAQT
jgi:hypothetical protein